MGSLLNFKMEPRQDAIKDKEYEDQIKVKKVIFLQLKPQEEQKCPKYCIGWHNPTYTGGLPLSGLPMLYALNSRQKSCQRLNWTMLHFHCHRLNWRTTFTASLVYESCNGMAYVVVF